MRPVSRSADPASSSEPLIPATLGVRHHSPSCAHAVRQTLESLRPTCILIEAPVDAIDALLALADPQTRLPVALLAVSTHAPVQRMSYPLSATSPEWVALRWARAHDVPVRGIDLPIRVLLGLDAAGSSPTEEGLAELDQAPRAGPLADPHEAFAHAAGEVDFDTWWERHVEHQREASAQQRIVDAYAGGLRTVLTQEALAGLELREAFMRRRTREVLAEGHVPERCVLICGALHKGALTHALPGLADAALDALPHLEARVQPIAYSQKRLSSASGYDAGTRAPAYLEALGAQLENETPEALPPQFLSALARALRSSGCAVSAAEVIDAVALARSLASLAGSAVTTFRDLADAARTCFTRADERALAAALETEAIGTGVGAPGCDAVLPPLERELRHTLQQLGLKRALTDARQVLRLDLRAPRDGPSSPHAQSRLLHRLHAADLPFAVPQPASGQHPAWIETWQIGWSPELEVALEACALHVDTLEGAARARLSQAMGGAPRFEDLSDRLVQAAHCGFPELVEAAATALRARVPHTRALPPLLAAHAQLTKLLRVRPELVGHLTPLRDGLLDAAISNVPGLAVAHALPEGGLDALALALLELGRVAALHGSAESVSRLDRALLLLSTGRDGAPSVRGLGVAVALDRGALPDAALPAILSSWLSRGAGPVRTAAFFGGLLHHHLRAAILEHEILWRHLDGWITDAPAAELMQVLSPLRQVFTTLTPVEHRRLASTLRRCWRDGPAPALPTLSTSASALAHALEPLDLLELDE